THCSVRKPRQWTYFSKSYPIDTWKLAGCQNLVVNMISSCSSTCLITTFDKRRGQVKMASSKSSRRLLAIQYFIGGGGGGLSYQLLINWLSHWNVLVRTVMARPWGDSLATCKSDETVIKVSRK
ncbi:hypothetical protein PSHT_04433, partial [Puccinia striiformis]